MSTWKKVLLWTGVILLVLILAPVVAFFSAYAVTKVPEPQELQTNQIATIYASDSSTLRDPSTGATSRVGRGGPLLLFQPRLLR